MLPRRLAAALLEPEDAARRPQRVEVEQLRGYLAEYRQRAEIADAATDPLRWQNTRSFLAKLSEVVTARERELAEAVECYRLEAEYEHVEVNIEIERRPKSLDQRHRTCRAARARQSRLLENVGRDRNSRPT